MTKKRQPNSSVVSVLDDENLNLNELSEEENLDIDANDVNYMNMDISTDNIEDIVTLTCINYVVTACYVDNIIA